MRRLTTIPIPFIRIVQMQSSAEPDNYLLLVATLRHLEKEMKKKRAPSF